MEAANRELAEEAGVSARRLEHLGSFYLAPGWCNEFMHAFLARDLVRHELEPDEDEEIEVVWLTPSEWEERLARGEILDGKSIAAWQLARLRLRQEGTVL